MEPQKIQDAFFSQRGLQREFLLDDGVGDRHFVLVQEVRERAVPLRGVADDRGRLAVARPVAEFLERGVQAVILGRIDAMDAPIERFKHALELWHRKDHPVREIELPVVAIDHHAQVVEMLLARRTSRLPRSGPPAVRRRRSGSRRQSAARRAPQSPILARRRSPCPIGPVATWTPGSSGPGWPFKMLRNERELRSTDASKYPSSA